MARPVKDGLDYFPFDVDFAVNSKTEAIMGEFGPKGVLVMIYLLSAVYSKGYYLPWDKLTEMQLVNRVPGLSSELINQIVNRLIAYGTFSRELFDTAKVLTSLRIQETYFDATKRRKSPKPTLYVINVDNNSHSSDVNVNINPQSKVKESKVNESKEGAGVRAHVFDLWQSLWGFPNAIAQQDLDQWIDDMGADLMQFAIEIAGRSNVQARAADKFIGRVVDGWQQLGVKTLDQAKKANADHEKRLSNAVGGKRGRKPNIKESIPETMQDGYIPPKQDKAEIDKNNAEFHERLAGLHARQEAANGEQN